MRGAPSQSRTLTPPYPLQPLGSITCSSLSSPSLLSRAAKTKPVCRRIRGPPRTTAESRWCCSQFPRRNRRVHGRHVTLATAPRYGFRVESSASLRCPLPLLVRILPAPHGRSASWRPWGPSARVGSRSPTRRMAGPSSSGPRTCLRPAAATHRCAGLSTTRRRRTCCDSTALALLLAGRGARGRISHVPLLGRAWTTQFEGGRDRPAQL